MMPAPTGGGWMLIILPPTRFSLGDKLARVKVVDGRITNATVHDRERDRRLHWVAELGSWEEVV